MATNKPVKSWSSRQALAMLAVGEVEPTDLVSQLLCQIDNGLLTHADAKLKILSKARAKVIGLRVVSK